MPYVFGCQPYAFEGSTTRGVQVIWANRDRLICCPHNRFVMLIVAEWGNSKSAI